MPMPVQDGAMYCIPGMCIWEYVCGVEYAEVPPLVDLTWALGFGFGCPINHKGSGRGAPGKQFYVAARITQAASRHSCTAASHGGNNGKGDTVVFAFFFSLFSRSFFSLTITKSEFIIITGPFALWDRDSFPFTR